MIFMNMHPDFFRRRFILGLSALPAIGMAQPASSNGSYVQALKRGGCVVLIRHAITVPGIGDPPGMRLDDCSTQRDLSPEGRAQSRRIGQWFAKEGLTPSRVRSSQWCRCIHTAQEAFSNQNGFGHLKIEPWTALNSFFQGHGNRDTQILGAMGSAKSLAAANKPGMFEVWVTHQVVVTALTQSYCAMGEMIVARHVADNAPLSVLARGLIV